MRRPFATHSKATPDGQEIRNFEGSQPAGDLRPGRGDREEGRGARLRSAVVHRSPARNEGRLRGDERSGDGDRVDRDRLRGHQPSDASSDGHRQRHDRARRAFRWTRLAGPRRGLGGRPFHRREAEQDRRASGGHRALSRALLLATRSISPAPRGGSPPRAGRSRSISPYPSPECSSYAARFATAPS